VPATLPSPQARPSGPTSRPDNVDGDPTTAMSPLSPRCRVLLAAVGQGRAA
jgi:hypothetical protein